MRASKHILSPHSTPQRAAALRWDFSRGPWRPQGSSGETVARFIAILALAVLVVAAVSSGYRSLNAGAQEASNGASPETSGSGSDTSVGDLSLEEVRDLYLEDQLANDYILGQHRADQAKIDAATASLTAEIQVLASDAASIERRLIDLDRSILGQETLLVQIAWERDQLLLRRSGLINSMIVTMEGIEHLRGLLTERAVAAYMVPTDGYKGEMINSNDFVELEKKLVLIGSVADADDAVLRLLQDEEQLLLRQQAEIDRFGGRCCGSARR